MYVKYSRVILNKSRTQIIDTLDRTVTTELLNADAQYTSYHWKQSFLLDGSVVMEFDELEAIEVHHCLVATAPTSRMMTP